VVNEARNALLFYLGGLAQAWWAVLRSMGATGSMGNRNLDKKRWRRTRRGTNADWTTENTRRLAKQHSSLFRFYFHSISYVGISTTSWPKTPPQEPNTCAPFNNAAFGHFRDFRGRIFSGDKYVALSQALVKVSGSRTGVRAMAALNVATNT
jgi:hypothetical protein